MNAAFHPKAKGQLTPLSTAICPPSHEAIGDDNPHMVSDTPSTLHRRIGERLAALGLSREAASRAAGLNKTYLRKLMERPGAVPGADRLAQLASVLETSTAWLLGQTDDPSPSRAAADPSVPPPRDAAPLKPASTETPRSSKLHQLMRFDERGRRMLEIYGMAAGSVAGQFSISNDPIAEVPAPPALANVVGAYVLMTRGDSMVPRYFPNDHLYVNPHQAVRPGDHVIIQTRLHDNSGTETWVKRYDGEKDDTILAWQYNPPGEILFKKRYVMHVHRVLPINELFAG